jgi:uncharacterized protein YndB with AHSA1/START domain
MSEAGTPLEGQLDQREGRWQLRFQRRLPHPPAKVWRALMEPEHLAAWFPFAIEGERASGAPLRFVAPDGAGAAIEGLMIACEPPALLEFRWGDGETLRFELQPDGAGCLLTLINTIEQVGKAARDAAGWHTCLDVLALHLDGQPSPWGPRERWSQVHPTYVQRFPAEASTIGPPA